MTLFFQTCAGILLTVILVLLVGNYGKELGLILALAAGTMVLMVAFRFLEPVMELLRKLEQVSGLDPDLMGILLKATGIGLVGEVASLVCQDGGNATLGKGLQILTTAVILWQSIPLFTALLELVQTILGEL